MIEDLIAYIIEDPIGAAVQLPAYALLIGGPVWLIVKLYRKKEAKKKNANTNVS